MLLASAAGDLSSRSSGPVAPAVQGSAADPFPAAAVVIPGAAPSVAQQPDQGTAQNFVPYCPLRAWEFGGESGRTQWPARTKWTAGATMFQAAVLL